MTNDDATYVKLPPFTRLTSNVKGYIDDDLGRCTAFIGRNADGKTARIDAAELALSGKHKDVGATGAAMLRLAAPEASGLFATLSGDAGEAKLVVDLHPDGRPKKPEWSLSGHLRQVLTDEDKKNLLPAATMRELISFGADRGRRAIFARWGEIDTIPEPRALEDDQRTLWLEGIEAVRKELGQDALPSDILGGMNSWFGRQKKAANAIVKKAQEAIAEKRQRHAEATAGIEQLPKLRTQLVAAKAWEAAATARRRLADLEAAEAAYRQKTAPLKAAEARRAEAEVAEAEQRTRQLAQIATLKEALEAAVAAYAKEQSYGDFGKSYTAALEAVETDAQGHGGCPMCGNHTDIRAILAAIAPRIEARKQGIDKAKAEVDRCRAALTDAETTYGLWERSVREAQGQLQRDTGAIREEYARLVAWRTEVEGALKDAPATYAGPAAEDLAAQIETYEQGELLDALIDEETKKFRTAEKRRDLAKYLETASKQVLNDLLAKVAVTAETAVNKHMPPGKAAKLDLDESAWTVVGRDGRPHGKGIFCGYERGALMIALAAAWFHGPLRVLILDDEDLAGFDPGNVRVVLDGVRRAAEAGFFTQVFITSTRPHELPDEGWTKIYVGDEFTEDTVPPNHSAAPPITAFEL